MDIITKTSTAKKPLLIMGIGNLLMGDEGLGVHFAKQLARSKCPPHTDVLDGGTGGFHLMPYFEGYEKVILVDATLGDGAAGTIQLRKPRFSKDFPSSMSTHDIGLKDLIESMLILKTLPEIYLFTVSINEVQNMQVELSPEIASCMETLHQQVLELAFKIS